MIVHYVLDARGHPRREPDDLRWSHWVLSNDPRRLVANYSWQADDGLLVVDTVFTGVDVLGDHGRHAALWGTDAYLIPHDQGEPRLLEHWNYVSRARALVGHAEMILRFGGRAALQDWQKALVVVVAAPLGFLLLDAADGKLDGVVHLIRHCIRVMQGA